MRGPHLWGEREGAGGLLFPPGVPHTASGRGTRKSPHAKCQWISRCSTALVNTFTPGTVAVCDTSDAELVSKLPADAEVCDAARNAVYAADRQCTGAAE